MLVNVKDMSASMYVFTTPYCCPLQATRILGYIGLCVFQQVGIPGIEPGISESTVGDDILLATAAPKERMFSNSLNLVPMGKESNAK